jgi:spore coat protein U-like protein
VEEILTFVAERYAAATRELEAGADSQKVVWARMMSSELVDLVLYRLYRLSPAEVEALEDRE